MSLLEEMKNRVKTAMKTGNTLERDVLRVVIGEVETLASKKEQGGKPVTEEQVCKIIRKVVESNKETLASASADAKAKLEAENTLLETLLPKLLSKDEISAAITEVSDEIKAAKSVGQAVGIAMKLLKEKKVSVDGNDVKTVVESLRG